ncbi:MAG: class I SAM-dependent methyltransferase [Fimbriimonadales bacterium]|jgi:SAM-dependent methyltransferase|nr:class I SAM-dependent methyltransferase [Fimbriimonadales bacterium]GBC90644.1 Erythromycin 3''-O-methyltransferase [bacterium HR14]
MSAPDTRQQIVETYQQRDRERERYSLWEPGNLFLLHSRERLLLRLLRQAGYYPLTERWILDIGCGFGGELRRWIGYGMNPYQAIGIDIVPPRLMEARCLSPNITFMLADGGALPFRAESFDLVLMFTVLSSVPESEYRQWIAREAWRVLKTGGAVVWYDFIWNPVNRAVVGIEKKELQRLFPAARFVLKRTTLAPPLARKLAPLSPFLTSLLETLPFLRTHYLGLLIKKECETP